MEKCVAERVREGYCRRVVVRSTGESSTSGLSGAMVGGRRRVAFLRDFFLDCFSAVDFVVVESAGELAWLVVRVSAASCLGGMAPLLRGAPMRSIMARIMAMKAMKVSEAAVRRRVEFMAWVD